MLTTQPKTCLFKDSFSFFIIHEAFIDATITLRNSAHSNVTCLINQINYPVMKWNAAFLLMPETKWVWHISVTALTLLVLDVFHLKTVSLCFGAKFKFQSFFCCFTGLKRRTVAFWCQFVCNQWDTAGEAVIPAPALICLSHRRCSNRIHVVYLKWWMLTRRWQKQHLQYQPGTVTPQKPLPDILGVWLMRETVTLTPAWGSPHKLIGPCWLVVKQIHYNLFINRKKQRFK